MVTQLLMNASAVQTYIIHVWNIWTGGFCHKCEPAKEHDCLWILHLAVIIYHPERTRAMSKCTVNCEGGRRICWSGWMCVQEPVHGNSFQLLSIISLQMNLLFLINSDIIILGWQGEPLTALRRHYTSNVIVWLHYRNFNHYTEMNYITLMETLGWSYHFGNSVGHHILFVSVYFIL